MNEANKLIVGDCLKVLPEIEAGSVDLLFADPPFGIGFKYDVYEDNLSPAEYLAWTAKWLAECKRVLAPTGSIWVAIGDDYAAQMKLALDAAGFTMRSWVIWHYTFGVNMAKNFTPSHTHLFYYVNDPKRFYWNGDDIRVRSARQELYGDKRAKNGGRYPDNTWVLRPEAESRAWQHEQDTWSVSRVCGTFKERTGHPCQMPEEILERIIRVSSKPGDLVLDPFSGSGTTLAVALRLQRRYLGIELSEKYAEMIRERLEKIEPAKKPRDLISLYEERMREEANA